MQPVEQRSFFIPEPVKKRPAPEAVARTVAKPKAKKVRRTFFIPEPVPPPAFPPNDQPVYTKDVPRTFDFAAQKRPWGADGYTGRCLSDEEVKERDAKIAAERERGRGVKWWPCIGCGKFAFPAPEILCYGCRRDKGLIIDDDEPPF